MSDNEDIEVYIYVFKHRFVLTVCANALLAYRTDDVKALRRKEENIIPCDEWLSVANVSTLISTYRLVMKRVKS
jgi:hypothetical protein